MKPELASLLTRRIHVDDSLPGQPLKEPNPYREWGDLPFFVSAFDHWLSEDEYVAAPFMWFSEAVKKGLLADYLDIERRFEALYADLGRDGVYAPDRWRRGRRFLPASSGRLKRIVRDSLRERGLFRRMDLVFVAAPVRAVDGGDLTDLLLPETPSAREAVQAVAQRCGLHVLPWEPKGA